MKYIDIDNSAKLPVPYLAIDEEEANFVKKYVYGYNLSKYAVINISASNSSRMWEQAKWIEFINSTKHEQKYVLISDVSHIDLAKAIVAATGIICFPQVSFKVLTALISKADLIVTPDTSFVHVAAAFDIPVISLTCNIPWNIVKFYPLSTQNAVIFPKEVNGEVGLISVEEVVNAWKNIKI